MNAKQSRLFFLFWQKSVALLQETENILTSGIKEKGGHYMCGDISVRFRNLLSLNHDYAIYGYFISGCLHS